MSDDQTIQQFRLGLTIKALDAIEAEALKKYAATPPGQVVHDPERDRARVANAVRIYCAMMVGGECP